jgi:adenosine kinase
MASFYAGAMTEARDIELWPLAERVGGLDLVVIGPNDPEAMLRHTEECRRRGIPFLADPSQQLAWMDGEAIRLLVDGAAYLFTNEYESALIEKKTGWDDAEVLSRVGVRVTTHGRRGSVVATRDGVLAEVGIARDARAVDPTGVGDAYRAGYCAGLAWDLPAQRCAQLGSLLAAYVVETVGTQEYTLGRSAFLRRLAEAYGQEAADEVEPHLQVARP